ncbi:MAG: hypothetical protein IJU56_00370, partial [Clostridia bacterium]|nr:hypothetical protein [Clostridia bacterium]
LPDDSAAATKIITDAKAAIDALTYDKTKSLDDNKAAVTTAANISEALATQRAADALEAAKAAFAAYKTTKKADLDALLQEGDSDAVKDIVGLAKTQVDGATYDESKTLDENKAALDTLVANVPTAIATQRAADALEAAKAAFAAYRTTKKADLDALLQEGDSDAVKDIVGLAKTQVDGATYDESKTLDENKAALDTLVANVPTAIATQRAADALAAAKRTAKIQLLSYKDTHDYRAEQKTELSNAIDNGIAAINAAADIAAVDAALAAAKTAMDAIKTDEQLTAEELEAAKTAAKEELDAYKNADDYRTAEKEDLANAIADAKAAIDAAADIAAVNAALTDAKAAIDEIKTDAQLTAEELEAAKTAAKEELDAYKNADDYRTAEKEDLANAIADAKAAIDGAADTTAVATALAAAKTAMDAIKTDAQLTAEELAAAKTAAKAALDNYKNAADYRTAEQEDLATAIAEAKAAIDAAADLTAVESAVAAAHTAMNAIKTDAELTAEEEAAAAAAALADAKAQLTTAVEAAKAFYDTIKDNEKYADIANALKTAYERGEAALASEDPAEILDFAANVAFATTTAQTDKAAADAEPTDEPSTPDIPDTPSDEKEVKVGNPFLYNIIKAVVDFIVSLFTKVLPAAMKLK